MISNTETPSELIEAKRVADDALAERAQVNGQIAALAGDRREIAARSASALAEVARCDKLLARQQCNVGIIGARAVARKALADAETALDCIDADISALAERGRALDQAIENASDAFGHAYDARGLTVVQDIESELAELARLAAPLLTRAAALRGCVGGALRNIDNFLIPSVTSSRPLISGGALQIGDEAPTVFSSAWTADEKIVAERAELSALQETSNALAACRDRAAAARASIESGDPELQKRRLDEQRQRFALENEVLRRRVAEAREKEAADEERRWADYKGTTAIRMPGTPAPRRGLVECG